VWVLEELANHLSAWVGEGESPLSSAWVLEGLICHLSEWVGEALSSVWVLEGAACPLQASNGAVSLNRSGGRVCVELSGTAVT
jgi:hypothetical protein